MINDLLDTLDEYKEVETMVVGDSEGLRGFASNKGGLSIIHFNIRSIGKNFDELSIYLENLNTNNIDIIILSETFIINDTTNFSIKGFKLFYNRSEFNKNDGLIAYVRNDINVNVSEIKFNEITTLRLEFQSGNITTGLTAVYRPPSTNIGLFMEDLGKYLDNFNKQQIEIFVGDININLLDKHNPMTGAYMDLLMSFGFFSFINKPTRVNELSSTLIDHIFVMCQEKVQKLVHFKPYIFHFSITDHYPIALNINIPENNIKKCNNRAGIKMNNNKLISLLARENWQDVYDKNSVDESYAVFIKKLQNFIEKSTEKYTISNKNIKLKPWISSGIIKSIRHRDKLKLELNKKYSEEKNKQYKTYRNCLTKIIKNAKNQYYKTKLNQSGNNFKKIWEVMDEAVNINKQMPKVTSILKPTNELTTDNKEIANVFVNYFTNIGKNMQKNIPTTNKNFTHQNTNKNSFYLTPVTENELITHISSLKNDSAPGEDNISAKTIKNMHIFLLKPLSFLINMCFSQSKIPQDWKTSIIIPVYKCGNRQEANNYRPISLINNFGKLFEKCLKTRLIDFLERNNLLYEKQFGFRSGKCTEDAVFQLINQINNNLNTNKKSLTVFIDLAKAFDTVSHKNLIKRMESLGVRGDPLNLFINYLSCRRQKVKVENEFSEVEALTMGVPQGTVLGPVLFLVYINGIGNITPDLSVISYADDTALLFEGNDWVDVYRRAEFGLGELFGWLNHSLLSLNVDKTKYIAFSASMADRPPNFELKIHTEDCNNKYICDCKKITSVKKIKYLGVVVDQHLRWGEQCHCVSTRIRKLYYRFYQLRDILSKQLLKIVYGALVESILRYCIIVWGGAYNNALHELMVSQNTIMKIIYKKNRRYPTNNLYGEANVLPLRALFVHCCLNYLHKIEEILPKSENKYNIRSMALIRTPLYIKSHTQRIITYFAPKFFNMLPENIKKYLHLKKKFKILTKTFIQNNYLKFIYLL